MPKEVKKRSSSSRASPLAARPSLEAEIRRDQDPGKLRTKKRAPRSRSEATRGAFRLRPAVRETVAVQREGGRDEENGEEGDGMLPHALSRKIMQQAESQQKEEEEAAQESEGEAAEANDGAKDRGSFRLREEDERVPRELLSRAVDEEDDEDEPELGDEEDVEELEISPEDEASLSVFLPSAASSSRRDLAQLILDKLTQHSTAATQPTAQRTLDPKVLAVYSQVASYLSRYTSGKVPKAFKIIPSLHNWEEVLFLTVPAQWTPQAVSAATRLFASALNEKMAQRYYNLVLLPRVRLDIAEHGKLNYHLYQSLRRSLFKPAAFFRGLVLPWCDEELTPRESVILASVLAKYSIPPLHSAVCILRLVGKPYSGPVTLLLRTLINKKYSLPVRVLEAVSEWIGGFAKDDRKMPLVWHQVVLLFVQRYGADLSDTAVTRLRQACRVQVHHAITKEVRKELHRVRDKSKEELQAPSSAAAAPMQL